MAQTKKAYLDYDGLQHLVKKYIIAGEGSHQNELTSKIDYIEFEAKLTTLESDPYGIPENTEFYYCAIKYGYLLGTGMPGTDDYLSQSSHIQTGTVFIPRVAKDNFLKLDSADIYDGVLQLYLTSDGYYNLGTEYPLLITADLKEYFKPYDYYKTQKLSETFITPGNMSDTYISTGDAADTYLTVSKVDEMVIDINKINELFL